MKRASRVLGSWFALAAGIGLSAGPAPARAWNDSGHMQVAAIAWELLTPATRAKAVALLKQHPRFAEDFTARMSEPFEGTDANASKDKWIFLHAATWPDVVRELPDTVATQYHRSTWHYINVPIWLNDEAREKLGAKIKQQINLDRDLPASGAETAKLNAVQALELAVSKLRSAGVQKPEKAVYLCWLMHLAGDVHQPLHAVALLAARRFPQGDLGGNSIEIAGRGKLHAVWDGALGVGTTLAYVTRKAKDYLARPELKRAGESVARATLFATWLEESQDSARGDVYHADILVAIDALDQAKPSNEPPKPAKVALPQAYFDRARQVSEQRAVEAGYRLATLIEQQLKP